MKNYELEVSNGDGGVSAINIGNTVFVDAVEGDDDSALRGRLDKPCLTVDKAKTLAVSGDNIIIWNDMTSIATTLNDSAKNLNYFIFARNLTFTGNIISDGVGVQTTVNAPNTKFTGANIHCTHANSLLRFYFDELNHTGFVYLESGNFILKGNRASKTNSGICFVFGYQASKCEIEVTEWFSTSSGSTAYFTNAGNVKLKNTKFETAGFFRINNSAIKTQDNNGIIENCTITCTNLELGINSTDYFKGKITIKNSKITTTSAVQPAIWNRHIITSGGIDFEGANIIVSAHATYFIGGVGSGLDVDIRNKGIIYTDEDFEDGTVNFLVSGLIETSTNVV